MEKRHECHMRFVAHIWKHFPKNFVLSDEDTDLGEISPDDFADRGKGKEMNVSVTNESDDDDG